MEDKFPCVCGHMSNDHSIWAKDVAYKYEYWLCNVCDIQTQPGHAHYKYHKFKGDNLKYLESKSDAS